MAEPPAKKPKTEEADPNTGAEQLPETEGDRLEQLLATLDGLVPCIPDAATEYFLNRSGFHTQDKRVIRMVSLATQKFIAEIAEDCHNHCKRRQSKAPANKRAASKDLTDALKEHGVNVARPPYYI